MTTQEKQNSTAIQQRIKKFEIFAENQGKINPSFNANEGKVNAKGMVAPPVPPRSPETKLSSQSELQKATAPKVAPSVPFKSHEAKKIGAKILAEQQRKSPVPFASAQSTPNSDSTERFKFTVNQPGFIHTTARKNHVGNGLNELNTKKNAVSTTSTPNVADKKKVTFADPEKYVIPDNASEKIGLQSVKTDMKEAHELNPFRELRERNGSTSSYSTTSSLSTSDNESEKIGLQSVKTDMKEAHELNPFRELRERNDSTSSYSTTSSLSTSDNESEKIGLQSVKTDMKEAHELNPFRELRERNDSTSSVDSQSTTSSKQADLDRMMMENINAFEQNPNVQSKSNPATIDDMLFGGVNDSTPCLEPQRSEAPSVQSTSKKADSPLDHNPIYQGKKRFSLERFKPKHPSQQIDQPDFTKPAEGYSNLERCQITHDGSKIEPKMERRSDNNVPPRNQFPNLERSHITHEVSTEPAMERTSNPNVPPRSQFPANPMHLPTRGNNTKNIVQPNASHEKKPSSEVSAVKTDDVRKKANRLVDQSEQGGRGC